MTTGPRAWSLDQCRDWLARDDGWTTSPDHIWTKPEWGDHHVRSIRAGLLPSHAHPIPATLDAIAGAMPEGWVWRRCNLAWEARKLPWGSDMLEVPDTGDERLDRARLACLCRMAQKEKQ